MNVNIRLIIVYSSLYSTLTGVFPNAVNAILIIDTRDKIPLTHVPTDIFVIFSKSFLMKIPLISCA